MASGVYRWNKPFNLLFLRIISYNCDVRDQYPLLFFSHTLNFWRFATTPGKEHLWLRRAIRKTEQSRMVSCKFTPCCVWFRIYPSETVSPRSFSLSLSHWAYQDVSLFPSLSSTLRHRTPHSLWRLLVSVMSRLLSPCRFKLRWRLLVILEHNYTHNATVSRQPRTGAMPARDGDWCSSVLCIFLPWSSCCISSTCMPSAEICTLFFISTARACSTSLPGKLWLLGSTCWTTHTWRSVMSRLQ